MALSTSHEDVRMMHLRKASLAVVDVFEKAGLGFHDSIAVLENIKFLMQHERALRVEKMLLRKLKSPRLPWMI
jgi:hypothetical protein